MRDAHAVHRFENWHQQSTVLSGAGALANLAPELGRLGVHSPAVLTSGSLVREGKLLANVRNAIGPALALEFDGVEAHAPDDVVLDVSERVRAAGADGLIVLGGGSAIDTAKGVVLSCRDDQVGSAGDGPILPVIVLPTTLSGSEYTNVVGNLDRRRRVKVLRCDDAVVPKLVVLDPTIASATPALIWGATGMKCLSDAVEQLCSPACDPIVTVLAAESIRRLSTSLAPAVRGDAAARLDCYLGAWMALFAYTAVPSGLGAGAVLRHQTGAVSGAPHASIACVLLPHVMRRTLPIFPDRHATLQASLQLKPDDADGPDARIDSIVSAVESLIQDLDGPTRLRDIGVAEGQLDEIAGSSADDFTGSGSPFALTEASLRELLLAAY